MSDPIFFSVLEPALRSSFAPNAIYGSSVGYNPWIPRASFGSPFFGPPSASATPTPPTPIQAVVNEMRRLNSNGTDISEISRAAAKIETENRQRIETSLKGMADMALIEKPKSRRFVLAYFKDGESGVVEGVLFDGDDDDEPLVALGGTESDLYPRYDSLASMHESLVALGIVHHIAFFDK